MGAGLVFLGLSFIMIIWHPWVQPFKSYEDARYILLKRTF